MRITPILLLMSLLLVFPQHSFALDSPDIQQLIDNLPITGGTITLPAGEHMLTVAHGSLENFPDGTPIQTAILINKDHVIFQGQGPGTILKLAPQTKMRVISISSDNVAVRNLVIDGNKSQRNGSLPYPGGDVVDGLLYGSQTASNLIFENLEIKNGIEDAMGSWKGTNIIGRNNYNHDNGTIHAGAAGFSLSGVKGGLALSNRLENNTATGIWSAFDASNVKITGNTIRNNLSGGITIGGGTIFDGLGSNNTGFEISDNVLSGNGSAGFATITIFASSNGVLQNNKIESSPFDNIQIDGKSDILSKNWTLTNNSCFGPIGIRVIGNSENITLRSNTCQSNVAQEIASGDLNLDGKVDIFDYNLVVSLFGNPYTIFDYNTLVAQYGK